MTNTPVPIKILIADDHQLMRQGLVSLLADDADLEVVGEATTGRDAAERACKLDPDVVVMDISMPDLNGIDAARAIHSRCPNAKIVALSIHKEHRFVVEMMRAGAAGYLPKICAFEELGQAIRCVHSGGTYLSSSVTGPVVRDLVNRVENDTHALPCVLSAREREVLQLIAEGYTNREVAKALFISVKTVEAHRAHIMQKLNIHDVAKLVKYAIQKGLVDLNV